MFRGDPCPPLYSLGEQSYMESLSRVRLESIPSGSGSPTAVRVVTVEVERTHAVLPALEYFAPVSSPVAPDLPSSRALCSRAL